MTNEVNIRQTLIDQSNVHREWQPLLQNALQTIETSYLQNLLSEDFWLPGKQNIFAAFRRDLSHCQYILFGESPYPRAESANGIAFYDAAVHELWSENGLSKPVNRATSLRNIMKTALLAEEHISTLADGKIPQSVIASLDKSELIQTIEELFTALQKCGFLLFNATPVLHPQRKPKQEARIWSGFVEQLLLEIKQHKKQLPTLVLWGQIANDIKKIPVTTAYPAIQSEHPYNISFIHNTDMLQLFKKLQLLTSV